MSSVSVIHSLILMGIALTLFLAIVEDARKPQNYRMLLSSVDVIFADVAQPDQARIVALNAEYFLKNGGHCVISIKASCIDSTIAPEAVFANEVNELKKSKFKPLEQVTLEPYERDHAMVSGMQLSSPYSIRSFVDLASSYLPEAPVNFSFDSHYHVQCTYSGVILVLWSFCYRVFLYLPKSSFCSAFFLQIDLS